MVVSKQMIIVLLVSVFALASGIGFIAGGLLLRPGVTPLNYRVEQLEQKLNAAVTGGELTKEGVAKFSKIEASSISIIPEDGGPARIDIATSHNQCSIIMYDGYVNDPRIYLGTFGAKYAARLELNQIYQIKSHWVAEAGITIETNVAEPSISIIDDYGAGRIIHASSVKELPYGTWMPEPKDEFLIEEDKKMLRYGK